MKTQPITSLFLGSGFLAFIQVLRALEFLLTNDSVYLGHCDGKSKYDVHFLRFEMHSNRLTHFNIWAAQLAAN
jgi:hypothetical protein